MAKCIGCGCVDERACAGGCAWLAVDRHAEIGVCSECPEKLPTFRDRYRFWPNEFSGKNAQGIGQQISVLTANRNVAYATRKAPGSFEVYLPQLSARAPGAPNKFLVRVREDFLNEELLDVVLAKLVEFDR